MDERGRETDEAIRETLRLTAETSRIMAARALADAKKSDRVLLWYPLLAGACVPVVAFAVAFFVFG